MRDVSASPSEESADAATIEGNRAVIARMAADTATNKAAADAYQQQLAQFRAQEARYREQSAQAARQAAEYEVAQQRYAAEIAAFRTKSTVAPKPAIRDPKDDRVTCEDVTLTGSRTSHRECHTRQEWKTMQ